jgi:phosphohistidine swiveling domain-containing protein
MLLYPLTDILNEQDFGGKASGLSKINSLGLLVPKGYAIDKRIHKMSVLDGVFPSQLIEELNEVISGSAQEQLIVRSSAIGEDGSEFSFAGQLDSFVVDNNVDSVVEGIKKCWNSLNNERVKAYQKISGKELKDMGVVIQQFMRADYSGVLFTQSPYAKNHTYTEYVKGGAEPLVSGKVTPLSFSTDAEYKLIENRKLPFDHMALIRNALFLKENFKKHLDIEWIYCNGQFYYVQARPVKLVEKTKIYWTNTNLNENYPNPISPLLYSIARDSYYHYFKNLTKILQLNKESIRGLEYDFSNSVGIFGNRIYYNMTSIHNIITASPYKAYFQDAFNKFVGYKDNDVSSKEMVKKPSVFRLVIRLMYLNLSLGSHVRKIELKVNDYVEKVSVAEGIKDMSICFYEFLDLRFYQWYHASIADLFSMIHYKLLISFTKRFNNSDHTGVHNTLIQAIPGLITNKPLRASWNILQEIEKISGGQAFLLNNDSKTVLEHIKISAEWQTVTTCIDQYLQEWGFRCSGELEFDTENYIEAPWKYIELLQSYIKCGQENPEIKISKMVSERRSLIKESAKNIFRKRHIFFPAAMIEAGILILLSYLCRNAISSREKVRYKQAQMYYNFKKIIFQSGNIFKEKGIIKHEKDILFLTYKEIGCLLSSSDMFTENWHEIIAIRKNAYVKESALKFPESFETIQGERLPQVNEFTTHSKKCRELIGLAVSGGKIQARVKILESVFEAEKIKAGEILVTQQTDPGWAMLFPIIGGLIVERGGALSHGAIVAREFGIPAVIGIKGITEILHDNDEVILDGDLGKIQIL